MSQTVEVLFMSEFGVCAARWKLKMQAIRKLCRMGAGVR